MAHHYAFPFFLVHFPVLLLLRAYLSRDEDQVFWKKLFISWGIGIAGFLIIASVWVCVVSAKYGRLIISSKGGISHAVMGPKDVDRRHPFFVGGLYKPKDDYAIHVYEDPSSIKFKTWSPFESKEYFIHQLKVIKDNSVYVFNHFVNQSPFFTYAFVIGTLTLFPLVFMMNPLSNKKKIPLRLDLIDIQYLLLGFFVDHCKIPETILCSNDSFPFPVFSLPG